MIKVVISDLLLEVLASAFKSFFFAELAQKEHLRTISHASILWSVYRILGINNTMGFFPEILEILYNVTFRVS